jgi:hypothetical protein
MKTLIGLVAITILTGCVSRTPSGPLHTGQLGVGVYEVSMPQIMGTNRAHLFLADCGQFHVGTVPYGGGRQVDTWIDWPLGKVNTTFYSSNVQDSVTVHISTVGTKVHVQVGEGQVYVVEADTNGFLRLRETKR